jgi:cytochrome c556
MPRIISLTAAESGQTPDELARQAVAAVATRRGLFRVINWAATPVLQMTQNQVPVEARQVAASALRIQSLAGMIPALYAIDTRPFPVETQSLDKIWGDLQGFDRNVDELADAAYALAAAARSDDKQAITQAARRVGTACSACHAAYRKPEGARQE